MIIYVIIELCDKSSFPECFSYLPSCFLILDGEIAPEIQMSAASAVDATLRLKQADKDWRELVGALFTGVGSPIDAPVHHQCSEVYGFGRCVKDVTDAQQRVWKQLHDQLASLSKAQPEVIYGQWKKINLICLKRPERAAGACDVPPPRETRCIVPKALPYSPTS